MPRLKRFAPKAAAAVLALAAAMGFCACSSEYVLNEKTFFKVMTNLMAYPAQYIGKTIEADLFMYSLTDVEDGTEYDCAVRLCSSGYGCTCGKDSVVGFVLEYDGYMPEAVNQSEKGAEKAWVHVRGSLKSADPVYINVYSYDGDEITGTEQVKMYVFVPEYLYETDGTGLSDYVTK